jgi:MSHA biogenesis protein MshM
MYRQHFGLHELPFGLTPDTAFVFSARSHQEALNTLLLAAASGEGFIKITGEVGTGKTLLCRRFLATLPGDCVSCYVPSPLHTPRTLLLALAEELGHSVEATATDEFTLLKKINDTLLHLAAEGRRVIVCVDEAQALRHASLETLRLLSNLETEKRKLMQVVLFGQPELDARLALPQLRQLRQRISFHYKLGALGRDELRLYLDHRLRVAGHRGAEVFSRGAVAALQRASGGTPRLVNILAHKALLAVFGTGGVQVERRHVRAAVRDSADSPQARFGWLSWILR